MTDAIRVGDVLAGKYRVERMLGVGGMGLVIAARHLRLDEAVAIKLLLPSVAKQPGLVERFVREARSASKIKSEHVVRVSDVDNLESGLPYMPYMVMELLDGCDLAALVHEKGPLPTGVAVAYVLEACEAIAEAHGLGIVHRDLKPANLFLARRRDGSQIVKVLDFGISKVLSPTGEGATTQTTALVGSPHYMSPEQLLSAKTVDARADLWALGVVLYELLAGSAPFRADTMPELCAMVLGAPLPRVRAVRPDVPPEVEAVILHCMERQPAQRFQTVVEVMSALAPFGAHDATQRVSRAAALLGVPPVSAARSASSAAGHRPSTPLPAPTMPFPLSPSAVKPAAPPPPTELFTPVPASGAPHTPAPLVPPTISGTAVTGPVAAPKRGLGLVLALVGAGVVLGPLLGWAVVRATSAPSAGAPATATPPSSAGESAPTAPSAAPAPVTPSAVAALSASASAAPSAAAPPTVTPASVPVARPTPPSRAAAAPAPAPAPSPRPAAAPPRPKDTIGF